MPSQAAASGPRSGPSAAVLASLLAATAGAAIFLHYLRKRRGPGGSGSGGRDRKRAALTGAQNAIEVALVKRTEVTHNTLILRFGLPRGSNCLGLGAGGHVAVFTGRKGDAAQPEVRRSYTPITTDSEEMETFCGEAFELLVKVYGPAPPAHPKGGVSSQRLAQLPVGGTVRIAGPTGMFRYHGRGLFSRKPSETPPRERCRHIAMIAGGTGITPMLQIMKHVAEDDGDTTNVHLLYANSSIDDVLLFDQLVFLGSLKNISVWLTVSQPPPAEGIESIPGPWKYSVGRVNAEMIATRLPPPTEPGGVLVLLCGPPAMISETCKPLLAAAGYQSESVVVL